MITLTTEQAEFTIYSLCVSYANTGEPEYIETANLIATETNNNSYFRGVNKALSIIYPIPVEPVEPEVP